MTTTNPEVLGHWSEAKEKELQDLKISCRNDVRLTMSKLSRDFTCCGWIVDLEYHLWRVLVEPEKRIGLFGGLAQTERKTLWRLAKVSGGWWMRTESEEREQFVPMAEWEARYSEWVTR